MRSEGNPKGFVGILGQTHSLISPPVFLNAELLNSLTGFISGEIDF
jgi:hypothetical protein